MAVFHFLRCWFKGRTTGTSLSIEILRILTSKYLHYTSSHHFSAKNSVVNTLVHRALSICDETSIPGEISHIKNALGNNGYPINLFQRAVNKQSKRQEEVQIVKDNHKGVTFKPYVQGVSEKVCRFLNLAGGKTYYPRSKNLGTFSVTPRIPKFHAPCIYYIPCSCGD